MGRKQQGNFHGMCRVRIADLGANLLIQAQMKKKWAMPAMYENMTNPSNSMPIATSKRIDAFCDFAIAWNIIIKYVTMLYAMQSNGLFCDSNRIALVVPTMLSERCLAQLTHQWLFPSEYNFTSLRRAHCLISKFHFKTKRSEPIGKSPVPVKQQPTTKSTPSPSPSKLYFLDVFYYDYECWMCACLVLAQYINKNNGSMVVSIIISQFGEH